MIVQKEKLNSIAEYVKWLGSYKDVLVKKGYYAPVKAESYGKEFEGWAVFLSTNNKRSISKSRR